MIVMSDKKGPWTIQNSQVVYKNPWMCVEEDNVIRPDGKAGIFGVVTMKEGVAILPMDSEGNVYLVEQYRYVMEGKTIEIVCGGVDSGETILDAAKRELVEETGITATDWTSMGETNPYTSVVKSTSHMFVARGLKFAPATPEGTEHIKVIKTTLEEAEKWVREGKITHGPSSVLILMSYS